MQNKRGAGNVLIGSVIFIILNIVFLSVIALYITRAGNTASVIEETYSKQMALFVDGAKPGTRIELDVSEIFSIGRDLDFKPILELECEDNTVFAKFSKKGGYRFEYFSDLKKCEWKLDETNEKFIINV